VRVTLAGLVAGLCLAACAGGHIDTGPTSRAGTDRFEVLRVDPAAGAARGWVPRLAGQNNSLDVAVGYGSVWVTTADGVVAVSPTTPGHTSIVRTTGAPYDLALAHSSIWAVGAGYTGWKVDPRAGRVTSEFQLQDSREHSVAADGRFVWVANFRTGVVQRIDPRTATPSGRVVVRGGIATDVATGFGSVWVIDGLEDAVDRIDPATLRITKIVPLPGTGTQITTGAGAVWVAEDRSGTVVRIDPRSGAVRSRRVGKDAPGLAVGLGAVWVTHRDGALTRLPAASGSGRIIPVASPRGPLAGVAVDRPGHSLWVTVCPPRLACGLVGQRAGGHAQ
jgi:streptogramin lyase